MPVSQGYLDIFAAVVLEPREVMLFSIDLDPDLVVDHQIDSLAVANRNLRFNPVTCQSKTRTGQAFRQRFAGRIDPAANSATFNGQAKDESLQVDEVDLLGMKRPIEGGHRILEVLVEDDPFERVEQTDGYCCASRLLVSRAPVQDDTARRRDSQSLVPIVLRAQPGGIVIDSDVEGMLTENPSPAGLHRRQTGQPSTDPDRSQFGSFLIHRRVPAVPYANHIAYPHRAREIAVSRSPAYQLLLLGHTAQTVDDLRQQCHTGIIGDSAGRPRTSCRSVKPRHPNAAVKDTSSTSRPHRVLKIQATRRALALVPNGRNE
jgi:hypothetical protein